jgi:hypothetical protein
MADARVMDRMFQRIMRGLVDTGTAPQYAELARALGLGDAPCLDCGDPVSVEMRDGPDPVGRSAGRSAAPISS